MISVSDIFGDVCASGSRTTRSPARRGNRRTARRSSARRPSSRKVGAKRTTGRVSRTGVPRGSEAQRAQYNKLNRTGKAMYRDNRLNGDNHATALRGAKGVTRLFGL